MKKVFAFAVAGIAVAAVAWIAFRPRGSAPRPGTVPEARVAPRQAAGPGASEAVPADAPAGAGPDAGSIIDLPDAPEGSPSLRIVDPAGGEPLVGAWAILHREEDEGGDPPAPIRGDARVRAGEDGILRIPEEILAAGAWDGTSIGAPDRPTIRFDIDGFRALFRLPPPGRPVDRSRAIPELGLPAGTPVPARVLDGGHRPIEGVKVDASGYSELSLAGIHPSFGSGWFSWSFSTSTDIDGRCAVNGLGVEDVPVASLTDVRFTKDGFLPVETSLLLDDENEITLFRAVCVTGAVADPDGNPIADAGIEATCIQAESEEAAGLAYSAADGSFSLLLAERLPSAIAAWAEGYRSAEIEDYVARPGEVLRFTLEPESRATARLLAGEERVPAAGALVRIIFPIGYESFAKTSDGAGRVSFPFPLGESGREILFIAPEAGFARLVVPALVDRDQDLGDVLLASGHGLEITLVDENGAPVPDLMVRVEIETCEEAEFSSLERRQLPSYAGIESDGSGRSRFAHLIAGVYAAEVWDPEWRIREDEGEPIEIRIPREAERIFVVVREGRITGYVVDLDGYGIPYAEVRFGMWDCGTDWRGGFALEIPGSSAKDAEEGESEGEPPVLFVTHDRFIDGEIPIPRAPRPGEVLDAGEIVLRPREAIAAGEMREIAADVERGIDLAGVVLDAASGTPIEGANVTVEAPDADAAPEAVSDEGGRFRLKGLAPGFAIIAAWAHGYDECRMSIDTRAGIRDSIRLFPNRAREGADAAPIRSVTILLDIERPDGLRLPATSSVSVEYGMGRLGSVPREMRSGCYRADMAMDREASLIRFRVLASCGYSDWISVAAAGEGTIGPIRVRLIAAAPTVVIVTDGAGGTARGARVRMGRSMIRTTDRDGTVELDPLPPGTYEVAVEKDGVHTRKTVEHLGGGDPIRVTLSRGATLEGMIRFAGEPFPVRVEVEDPRGRPAEVNPPGSSFTIDSIEPGAWDVAVCDGAGALLFRKRMRFDDAETLPIEIDLPSLGAIEGKLHGAGGSGIAGGVEILLRGDGLRVDGFEVRQAVESDGRFTFPHVVSGTYLIRYGGLVGESRAIEIPVRAGQTARVDLAFRLSAIRGTVKGPDGAGPAWATVTLAWDEGESDPFHVSPNGSFEILGIAEGPYRIRIEGPGFVPFRAPVDIEGDRRLDVTLRKGAGDAAPTPDGR